MYCGYGIWLYNDKDGDQALKSEFSVNPREALMITGDESLVNTETVIQYKITNVRVIFSMLTTRKVRSGMPL